jgi:K+-transporting ATPase KdpF subunit
MSLDLMLGAVLAVGLFSFFLFALLRPEKF